MELKVVLDKKDYDALQKEITDLKELIDTKVITRTDTEENYGGLYDWRPLSFVVYSHKYTGAKEIIDEINDGIIKGDTIKIKELENDIALKDNKIIGLEELIKTIEDGFICAYDWKKLNLFRRIFIKPIDKQA